MSKRLGNLIRQARTDAGLTQEQLARRVRGLSASDISLAERGEKELTQAELKEIAKETGVTQKSLLDAAKTGASGGKTGSGKSSSDIRLTGEEKKLIRAYREADSKSRAVVKMILLGKDGSEDAAGDMIGSLMNGVKDLLEK